MSIQWCVTFLPASSNISHHFQHLKPWHGIFAPSSTLLYNPNPVVTLHRCGIAVCTCIGNSPDMAPSSCSAGNDYTKKLISELTRGQGITEQLRRLLEIEDTHVVFQAQAQAQSLVGEISASFVRARSILHAGWESDEVSQISSVISCKSKPAAQKDRIRRDSYKRRKPADRWIRESPNLFEDGHVWRKYGQKGIMNANYTRNYFRCTHKYDQSCPATKHVQQISDDPPLFRTTYTGQHTCKRSCDHQTIMDAAVTKDSSIILNFGHHNKPETSRNGMGIQKYTVDNKDMEEYQLKSSSASHCYLVSPDFTPYECDDGLPHLGLFSSCSHHGDVGSSDVYSCSASNHSMDMDMMVGSVFDEFMELDHIK